MAKRKKDNEDLNQNQADDSADNFGLPDIEYKPLDRTETEPPVEPVSETHTRKTVIEEETVNNVQEETSEPQPEAFRYDEDEEEPKSSAPIIITVVIILVLAAAGFLIYKYVYVPRAEKAKLELVRQQEEAKQKQEAAARAAKEQEEAERKRLEAEAAAKAKPAVGTITSLSAPTHKFYVVLASDIDDDLIMDYAKRLSATGVSTLIVPPFGSTKFYRLAMGDFGTYADAQSSADGSKATYGNALWVIKY